LYSCAPNTLQSILPNSNCVLTCDQSTVRCLHGMFIDISHSHFILVQFDNLQYLRNDAK